MPALLDRSPSSAPAEQAARWPGGVRAELARRRARVLDGVPVGALVLDLADPGARARVQAAGHGGPAGAPVDVVVSVASLALVADLPGMLAGVAAVLDPAGRFLFVEPTAHPGWPGVLASSAGSCLPSLRGLHLGRDVPLALRHAGLPVTDLERFTMSTPLWPLRSFVDGCARPAAGLAGR